MFLQILCGIFNLYIQQRGGCPWEQTTCSCRFTGYRTKCGNESEQLNAKSVMVKLILVEGPEFPQADNAEPNIRTSTTNNFLFMIVLQVLVSNVLSVSYSHDTHRQISL